MTDISVLIVDDHPVVRAGLRQLLTGQDGITVAGEATDGAEAVHKVRSTSPDVVLMDLQMPGTGGVDATEAIAAFPDPPAILILTVYDSDADIFPAITAGAAGYLLKDAPPEELVQAVLSAATGETVLAPAVAARLVRRSRTPQHRELTAREIQIVEQLARGASNRDIASELHVSEATIKTHLVHIYEKLDVDSRTAAVRAALDRGHVRLKGPET